MNDSLIKKLDIDRAIDRAEKEEAKFIKAKILVNGMPKRPRDCPFVKYIEDCCDVMRIACMFNDTGCNLMINEPCERLEVLKND